MNQRFCLASFLLLTGAAAGSVLLTAGCSPAVEPLPRGATHYRVDFPTSADVQAEGTCNATGIGGIGAGTVDNPEVPDLPISGSDLRPTDLGTAVVHSKEAPNSGGRYEVACSVKESNGSFSINANLEGPNTSPSRPPEGGLASIEVRGTIDADTGTGSGNVTVRTVTTQNVRNNVPCELRALTEPADASEFQLKPGEAAFTFFCPNTTGSLDQFSRCETLGTVVLETCSE